MKKKTVFQILFASLAVILIVLPFVVSINDVLTEIVEHYGWYIWLQKLIVPWEAKMVATLVGHLGIKTLIYPTGLSANGNYVQVSWNCIGWQSLILFVLSLIIGFKAGKYTMVSKFFSIVIGLGGIMLVNLLRMAFTVILLVYSRQLFAVVFHDYLSAFATVGYLFLFWWFSYSYILEDKQEVTLEKDSKV